MDLELSAPDRCTRVLVVEDDEMQAQILQLGLAGAGFEVDIVNNGLAAVGIAADRHYDAVLIDYNIPEIDGLATARLLGDFFGPVARPVLIAFTATPERLIARESGANSAFDLVLDKSCGLSAVISAITSSVASAPDTAAKQAARDVIDNQSEDDNVAGPRHPAAKDKDPDPLRILVVEDDESQRLLLANVLQRKGYVVETASDGLAAIRRIREKCCDLALVDYHLPEISGLAVASLVNGQMAQASRPRLVALTATPDLLYVQTAVTGPMFDRIVDKSSGLHELISSVDHLLRFSTNPETRRAAARILPTDAARARSLL
jgi:CheY-like chemotaxis protein